MQLVLYGKEDVDELERWAREIFYNVSNRGLLPPQPPNSPYPAGYSPRLIVFKPLGPTPQLVIVFQTPSQQELHRYGNKVEGASGKIKMLCSRVFDVCITVKICIGISAKVSHSPFLCLPLSTPMFQILSHTCTHSPTYIPLWSGMELQTSSPASLPMRERGVPPTTSRTLTPGPRQFHSSHCRSLLQVALICTVLALA